MCHHRSSRKDADNSLTTGDADLERVHIHHSASSVNFLLTKLVRETTHVTQKVYYIHLVYSPQVRASTLFVVVLKFTKHLTKIENGTILISFNNF